MSLPCAITTTCLPPTVVAAGTPGGGVADFGTKRPAVTIAVLIAPASMPGAEKRTTATELLSGSKASAIFMSAGVLPWLARKAVIAAPAASPDSSSTASKLVRTIVTPLMVAGRSASSEGAPWAWPTVGNGTPPVPPGA